MVDHPARPDRHRRPDRQRRRQLRLGRRSARSASFTVAVYVGLALVLFVVYPVLLRAHGLSPRRFFAGAWPAIQLAFVSRSSIGTLPVTERVTERNLGVPRSYASFAVPLGATTKMDGCAAIYPAIAAIFVAQFFGVHLSITDYLLIALVSVIGSAATAGITGAIVMLTLTLSTLGLPLAGVGLLLAIDPILDMGRTAVNVAGQALVPTIVAKREGILDVERYRVDVHRRPAGPGRGERRCGRRPARAGHGLSPASPTGPVLRAEGRARRRPQSVQVRAAGLVGQQRPEVDRPAGPSAVTHGVAAFAEPAASSSACAWSPVAVTQVTSGSPPVGSPGRAGPGHGTSGCARPSWGRPRAWRGRHGRRRVGRGVAASAVLERR